MNDNILKYHILLTHVLRHKPEYVGVTLDGCGWVNVSTLLKACHANGHVFTEEMLVEVVKENDGGNFVFSDDKQKIKASAGHSFNNENLNLQEMDPPETLWFILIDSYHVYFAEKKEDGKIVGGQFGKQKVVQKLNAELMARDGYRFYRSEKWWLSDYWPPKEYTDSEYI